MTHIDGQQIAALAIVTVAAVSVGKRLWSQIRGFGSKPSAGGGCATGCGGCGNASGPDTQAQSAPALIQLKLQAPPRITRPSAKP